MKQPKRPEEDVKKDKGFVGRGLEGVWEGVGKGLGRGWEGVWKGMGRGLVGVGKGTLSLGQRGEEEHL